MTIRDFTPRSDSPWAHILPAFHLLLDRYDTLSNDGGKGVEVAYLNGERALIGMLANAVTLIGGAALVEFQQPVPVLNRCRADLWFRFHGSAKESWLGEGKHEDLPGEPADDLPELLEKRVIKLWNRAATQLSDYGSPNSPDRRVAIAFVTPTRAPYAKWHAAFTRFVTRSRPSDSPQLIAAASYERDGVPAEWSGIPHPGCMVFVGEA